MQLGLIIPSRILCCVLFPYSGRWCEQQSKSFSNCVPALSKFQYLKRSLSLGIYWAMWTWSTHNPPIFCLFIIVMNVKQWLKFRTLCTKMIELSNTSISLKKFSCHTPWSIFNCWDLGNTSSVKLSLYNFWKFQNAPCNLTFLTLSLVILKFSNCRSWVLQLWCYISLLKISKNILCLKLPLMNQNSWLRVTVSLSFKAWRHFTNCCILICNKKINWDATLCELAILHIFPL